MTANLSGINRTRKALELRTRLAAPQLARLSLCEPRLVLSAQLLTDVVDPWPLEQQSLLASQLGSQYDRLQYDRLSLPALGTATAIDLQNSASHQQTGWNSVQQEFGLRGTGQTVVVIDSGIAWDHVALGRGFGSGYRVVGGWDFAENDANPYDDAPAGFHGTHVAGIIGSDSSTTPGVAPGVDLVGLRVFNDAGQGSMQWVEQALAWVHTNRHSFENPITTVNLSLGSVWNSHSVPNWGVLEDELKQLYDDGILVTASAGNAFKQYNVPGLSYPAASPYVLPVASVDSGGQLSDFSQRSDRVIAAPGRNILSTVPDHVLGRDGRIDDFTTATGTSMAAPYVAGAAVLVREAMEMVGIESVTPARIIDWLHTTADTVYDTITNTSYHRLNLHSAIDALLPDDNVGDNSGTAQTLALTNQTVSGWINSLNDTDVYRFTADQAGRLTLDADSDWLNALSLNLQSGQRSLGTQALEPGTFALEAGQSYELHISARQEIGPFTLQMAFQPNATPVAPIGPGPVPGSAVDLGHVDLLTRDVAAGTLYRAIARHDGIFSVEWNNPDSAHGSLSLRDASGTWHTDNSWSNGALRLDVNAAAGQVFDILLPGSAADQGRLTIVDLVSVKAGELKINDTFGTDTVKVDLSQGVGIEAGSLRYEFPINQVQRISVDGLQSSDQLIVTGSPLADKVAMHVGRFTLENSQLTLVASNMERVHFDSRSGAGDRLSMFDSDGNDTLTVRADRAELAGLGYHFSVENMSRFQVNATGQGEDVAFMYDSVGDDRLSVRPQFTSLSSDHYFVSVSGFERVFVYANAGGYDTAELYDSVGNDRFATSGEAASIVGPGYFASTKGFERVAAHASAGGQDVALLYGSSGQTQWLRGSDFVRFNEGTWDRNARGFAQTDAFINGLAQTIPSAALLAHAHDNAAVQVINGQPNASDASAVDQAWPPPAPPVTSQPTLQTIGAASEESQPLSSWQLDDYSQLMSAPLSAAPDLAAHILLDVIELQQLARTSDAHTDLQYHLDPSAERDLLDEIFSELGKLP